MGYLKEKVFQTRPRDIPSLKTEIRQAIEAITLEMIQGQGPLYEGLPQLGFRGN